MGDNSDNVPGVSGVGEKTAVKLLKEYGSMDGVLSNVEKVKNKRVYNGLKDGVENAKLSKKLVTILTNVDLPVNVLECEKSDFNTEACKKKFTELEFHAILNQFNDWEKTDHSDKDS